MDIARFIDDEICRMGLFEFERLSVEHLSEVPAGLKGNEVQRVAPWGVHHLPPAANHLIAASTMATIESLTSCHLLGCEGFGQRCLACCNAGTRRLLLHAESESL